MLWLNCCEITTHLSAKKHPSLVDSLTLPTFSTQQNLTPFPGCLYEIQPQNATKRKRNKQSKHGISLLQVKKNAADLLYDAHYTVVIGKVKRRLYFFLDFLEAFTLGFCLLITLSTSTINCSILVRVPLFETIGAALLGII